jgi:hypothetical protein
MLNIYNGTAELNSEGVATVELPAYFEALNKDYRYQLTSIGVASPNLHISQEVSGNRFGIAGGQPSQKVSWQVTGIRQDAWANANRIPVEEDKPDYDKGFYLYPEAHGKESKKGIGMVRNSAKST